MYLPNQRPHPDRTPAGQLDARRPDPRPGRSRYRGMDKICMRGSEGQLIIHNSQFIIHNSKLTEE